MAVKKEDPQKARITFGKFENVDMRVAKVISAPVAEGTRYPCRMLTLDLGHLGSRTSVGQYALIPEEELVGRLIIACVNLGDREMGTYVSQALALGVPHPESPPDQAQATPLYVSDHATPGDLVF